MIDQIIKKIMERLQERNEQSMTIAITEMPPSETVFLHYGKIILQEADAAFCCLLFDGHKNEWSNWLKKADEYGTTVEIHLFDAIGDWFNNKWLVAGPFAFYNHEGKRVVHVSKRIICYEDVVILPNQACLIQEEWQRVTPLAADEISRKQIIPFFVN